MINSLSNAIPATAQPTASVPPSAAAGSKSTPAKSQPATTGQDTVQLSRAAQAALAALKEATETQAQTAKEAGGGDLQAQRLLSKEAAAKRVP